jgi:PAS domain S-box-containing protein
MNTPGRTITTEEALREREFALAVAQRMARLGSWALDLSNLDDVDSNTLWWSDQCYRLFGYQPGTVEVTNELFFRHVHPEDRPAISAAVARAIREHTPYSFEHRIVLPDGSERVVHEWAEVLTSASGRPVRLVGAIQDITERKRTEEALRKALAEVETLKNRLQAENVYLQEEIKTRYGFDEIIGRSAALKKVLRQVEQVAPTDSTVLISGETGTGKELLARAVHNLSRRKDRPLVTVNCGAISPGLVESELFGHEKGAFTGALARKIGRFELADGGTIFLDEIGDMPLDLQVKLLRVLQEGQFERVGGSKTLTVDVRVIAATHCDLNALVEAGKFRADLYYRLNIFPIRVPALRERKEDIPLLVRHLVVKYGMKMGRRIETIPQAALDALAAYDWPGNVRELGNVIERSVIISRGTTLELGDWLAGQRAVSGGGLRARTLEEVERAHIIEVLESTRWRVSGPRGAATILGVKPTTLEARMKKLGIARPS